MKIYEIDFSDEYGSQASRRCEVNDFTEACVIAHKCVQILRTETLEDSWVATRIKMLFAFKK